jgi:hypothetical protein
MLSMRRIGLRQLRFAPLLVAGGLAIGLIAPAFDYQMSGSATHNGVTSTATCFAKAVVIPVTNVYSTVEKTGSPYWNSAGGYTDFWVNITARVPNSTGAVTVTANPRIRAYPDGNWNEWNYCAGCSKYSVTWVKGYKGT